MKVRVSLGLKPEFDKLLADYGPHCLPPLVFGIAVDENGGYVFAKAMSPHTHAIIRHYDRDGQYVGQLTPPPANIPPEKLGGVGSVEYESGKRAIHGPDIFQMATDAFYIGAVSGKRVAILQPVVMGGRIYYANGGGLDILPGKTQSKIFHIGTDGSTDLAGMDGLPFIKGGNHPNPRLAISPDGKQIYMVGLNCPAVMVYDVGGESRVFAGKLGKGNYNVTQYISDSSNEGFNDPQGIDCDGSGRVYVADTVNSRIQVFEPAGSSAKGKWLKTIPLDRPQLIRVHRKSGALYVIHAARIEGRSMGRLTKFKSFDEPKEVWHMDFQENEPVPSCMAVDEWSAKPRLWTGGGKIYLSAGGIGGDETRVRIWEDNGIELKKVVDFEELAQKYAGAKMVGRWNGVGGSGSSGGGTVACDPTREKAYFMSRYIFDLKTGVWDGDAGFPGNVSALVNDISFDKKGYAHLHFSPGHYMPGVARVDPGRKFQEVPYDYGLEKEIWRGLLPVRDQPGPKYFQDGVGVNMAGDVAEVCNIYYAPKIDDGFGNFPKDNEFYGGGGKLDSFNKSMRDILEREKKGEEVYSIRRSPGAPVHGATIWTYNRNGEVRDECALIAGGVINGSMIDEDGHMYFVRAKTRMLDGKPFLSGKGGIFGAGKASKASDPFTGTLIKTGKRAKTLLPNAPVPLEESPARPPEFADGSWMEGAEWMYAGASPIVPDGCCSCPTQRIHLDWYKRVYVPESYRHSVGVLDGNGNLIMHLGSYGNYDSGFGAKSKVPVGGDNIAFYVPRHISGTDNYLVVSDWGERLVVLKLNYQAEESVGIGGK
ncbi:MAG: hypothetical protein C0404_04100 [Verrucomicrobia bacterium]|nr:hypothetical protein [Verrucomicrobiota bacterium]